MYSYVRHLEASAFELFEECNDILISYLNILFCRAMFELPNKKGAEIVLHALFKRLNPALFKEAFR